MKTVENLLPEDGQALYFPGFFGASESEKLLEQLRQEIPWKSDRVKLFGKEITMRRQSAWFADDGLSYKYSGVSRSGLPWTDALLQLKSAVEKASGQRFNSCLANLYFDGMDGMGWHSDDEKEIERDSAIASVSFGEKRRFLFRHKTSGETIELELETGSLLLMLGEVQRFWKHSVPKSGKVRGLRINLTFRRLRR